MSKLRLTQYRENGSGKGWQWEKLADYFIETDGTPSVRVSPHIRESDPYSAEVAEYGIPERKPVYSHSLDRNVPFEDGETYLQALSEFKSTYTKWEWHETPASLSQTFLVEMTQVATNARRLYDEAMAVGITTPLVRHLELHSVQAARVRDMAHDLLLTDEDEQQGAVPRANR